MDQLTELVPFLQEQKPEIKILALQHIAGVSGEQPARDVLKKTNIINLLIRLIGDENQTINRLTLTTLINFCQDNDMLNDIVKRNIVPRLVDGTTDTKNKLREIYSILLSNITHTKEGCISLMQYGRELQGFYILKLSNLLTVSEGDEDILVSKKGAWVVNILLNITQIEEGRNIILNQENAIFKSLLPLIQHQSVVIRRGIVGIIRNCCFSETDHPYLLSESIDVLTKILLLIRGSDILTDEEMEGMNQLLHNKPEQASIEREQDKETRKMVIESLIFLTGTKESRAILRDKKTYPIIRNYHLTEKDETIGENIEKIVEMLIRDEEEEDTTAKENKVVEMDTKKDDDDNDASTIEIEEI
ncbi:armadillo-like helical domain-containing protein [Heterostelium album PN500]|uniref:Protein HGH1 homolog n=1 Tax=Heterostelium pallidum (strain ATCC 26659 / Pp 5 / PN500) TaxID=670386 RepID=D3BI19_HETP5|nr:armadillo-like helical domain-containing protein [Heterostelium album PN500]EFA78919.1 armadillo-like helical domain-containing protein [Heterostelium album PN500]|eukprot:XP_020431043.1 armadillo-like helical domain-containing protein [Heterostelium album PN500]